MHSAANQIELTVLVIGLALAVMLGYVTHRLRLSSIVGYLLAGFVMGPHSLKIVAETGLAVRLAEIGVILLMFGVGLRLALSNPLAVKGIAILEASGQILAVAIAGVAIALTFGLSLKVSLVLGLGTTVASSAVLIHVLTIKGLLDTPQGHIAVGLVNISYILMVLVLVFLPQLLASSNQGGPGLEDVIGDWGLNVAKLVLLGVLILPVGGKAVTWLLEQFMPPSRSLELPMLAVWSLAFVITTGSARILGTSMAVGAFLAGIVIGRTKVNHHAAAHMVPMREAFAVIFFIAMGMLFDPFFVVAHPGLVMACLFVILFVKPLIAGLIAAFLGYSVRTVLTVALVMASIGEFSFILAQQANRLNILSQEGYNVLITCTLISITLTPILFRGVVPLENWLRERNTIWRYLNRRAEKKGRDANNQTKIALAQCNQKISVVVVGYGPVGQKVVSSLRDINKTQIIIDWDVDIVSHLVHEGHMAVYGDGSQPEILRESGIELAESLLITLSDLARTTKIIAAARILNPQISILDRTSYLTSIDRLAMIDVASISVVKETAHAMVDQLLLETNKKNGHSVHQRKL